MNLAQMQMEYDVSPSGKLVLKSKRIEHANRNQPRVQQGKTRAAKSDYRPRQVRPAHDTAWK